MIRKLFLLMVSCLVLTIPAVAQNKYEEAIDIDVHENQLIIVATVMGTPYHFLLDVTRPSSALLAECADKIGLVVTDKTATLEKLGVGENLFVQKMPVEVISDKALEQMGVSGVFGVNLFNKSVLTIDKKGKNITLSSPYKPEYMSLHSRADMIFGDNQAVTIDGITITASVDSLLNNGVITLDFTKGKTYFERYENLKKPVTPQLTTKELVTEGAITHLDRETFLKDVFNFRKYNVWHYQGDMPCLIYFWAPWCGPCRKLSPDIKDLADQYNGRVKFYKINLDEEREVAEGYFKVTFLPTFLFIPMKGEPKSLGLMTTKEEIKEKIDSFLIE